MKGSDETGARISVYLSELGEETMRRAWGEASSPEYRRRVVLAALIFGEQFREHMQERSRKVEEPETQRFLMELMNAVVEEFAAREELSPEKAAEFLSDVGTRDRVLEFDEVLDAYEQGGTGKRLDDLLREAVESRRERASRPGRRSSG